MISLPQKKKAHVNAPSKDHSIDQYLTNIVTRKHVHSISVSIVYDLRVTCWQFATKPSSGFAR